jgi:hypothetical protein
MAEKWIDIEGWLVAEVETHDWETSGGRRHGGRLFLFRSPERWTLLSVRHATGWEADEGEIGERPVNGDGTVTVSSYAAWPELKAGMDREFRSADWRDLVEAGAENDPELRELWAPVQIDLDLEKSTVHRPELGAHGWMRLQEGWRASALRLATSRLEELGFVVLSATTEHRKVFRRGGLGAWAGNEVVGAIVAAEHGWRAEMVVAVDGFGEVYTRTPDTSFDPGTQRRYPPRRLNEPEARRVEEVQRQRRFGEEMRGGE